jgi:hypothetical protein
MHYAYIAAGFLREGGTPFDKVSQALARTLDIDFKLMASDIPVGKAAALALLRSFEARVLTLDAQSLPGTLKCIERATIPFSHGEINSTSPFSAAFASGLEKFKDTIIGLSSSFPDAKPQIMKVAFCLENLGCMYEDL